MPAHLPSPMQIRDLLSVLLDRDVTISPSAPLAPGPRCPCTIGVYVDDTLQVTCLVAFDLDLSARTGAAIGLVPVSAADVAITDGVLDDTLRENVHEVLNVTASLFNIDGATHVRLYDVHHVGIAVPPDILARSLTLGHREDLAVELPAYGPGKLSVLLV